MRPAGGGRKKLWPLIMGLSEKGVRVYAEPIPTNISIVLDGKTENPLCFHGKRVLAYWKNLWDNNPSYFDEIYKPILEEYYDDMIDLTDTTFGEALEVLLNYEA